MPSRDEAIKAEARDWLRRCAAHYTGQEARLLAAFGAGAAYAEALGEPEIDRLRKGLEDALAVSLTVGLLRLRASRQGDAELEKWGERLKAQLVAIREVLWPGTAAAHAEMRRERGYTLPDNTSAQDVLDDDVALLASERAAGIDEDALFAMLHEYRRCSENEAREIIGGYLAAIAKREGT